MTKRVVKEVQEVPETETREVIVERDGSSTGLVIGIIVLVLVILFLFGGSLFGGSGGGSNGGGNNVELETSP